jgi:hypothetical protein
MVLRIATAVLATAVAGLAIALAVVAGNAASDNDQQAATLARADKRIAVLEHRVANSGSGNQAKLTALAGQLKLVNDCLPEVQTEVDSLEIDRETLFISPSNQLSRVCQPLVYPRQADAAEIGD